MLDYKKDFPVPESYFSALSECGAFVVTTGGMSLKDMEAAPSVVREWVSKNLLDAHQKSEIIKTMKENGVLIVAGTDAQGGQMNFAEDYFLEFKLYEMAGLSNEEILRTATGNAAKAFGLPIGELKVGSKALAFRAQAERRRALLLFICSKYPHVAALTTYEDLAFFSDLL